MKRGLAQDGGLAGHVGAGDDQHLLLGVSPGARRWARTRPRPASAPPPGGGRRSMTNSARPRSSCAAARSRGKGPGWARPARVSASGRGPGGRSSSKVALGGHGQRAGPRTGPRAPAPGPFPRPPAPRTSISFNSGVKNRSAAGQGLLADEAVGHLVQVGLGHLYVIAEDPVEAHLQGGDAGGRRATRFCNPAIQPLPVAHEQALLGPVRGSPPRR